MYLFHLSLQDFKNYNFENVEFSAKITSLVGNNGAGKTNILDAIHYLSFCKSYFSAIDSFNISHKKNKFSILGKFSDRGGQSSETAQCIVRRNQRKIFKYNGKEVERLADHIGRIPAIMVSPYDHILIDGGSEERRKYIDIVISQYDRSYLNDLIAYNRALSQRNKLLKQMASEGHFDDVLMEPWNDHIIKHGKRIYTKRVDFISSFAPVFIELYRNLSGDAEGAGIKYMSHLFNELPFENLLKRAKEKDRILKHSTVGTHKDDLVFSLSGVPAKRFGSQGQQKTFIIALKLAQYSYLCTKMDKKPLLLLDDIFDKLDKERIERLMELVSGTQYGQIVITDTNALRIETIFSSTKSAKTDILQIDNGKVSKVGG